MFKITNFFSLPKNLHDGIVSHKPIAATLASLAIGLSLFAFAGPAFSQDDLSDNETCLECHSDTVWTAPENSDRPRVHQDSGAFFVEDHEMWSCTDCHTQIVEIPHEEGIEQSVDCTDCHETTPE